MIRDHAITVDDYATLAAITDLAVSPDGKHVAYCEGRWDTADDKRKTDLWVVATDGKGKPTRLTGERANDRHPKWARDGKAVYVLANRKREAEKKAPYDGTTQVWRVSLNGGEPLAVTRVEGGSPGTTTPRRGRPVLRRRCRGDGQGRLHLLRSKYKQDYGHGRRKVSEVYRLDLQSWRAEKVIDDKRYVREFAVTRDGKRVGMITAPDDTVIKSEGSSRIDVWDADTKKVAVADEGWMKTAASPWPWLESLAWAPDGKRLAFCSIFDAYPAEIIIHTLQGGTWTAERMGRPAGVMVRGYGTPLTWEASTLKAGELYFLSEFDGASSRCGKRRRRCKSNGTRRTPSLLS